MMGKQRCLRNDKNIPLSLNYRSKIGAIKSNGKQRLKKKQAINSIDAEEPRETTKKAMINF